MDGPKSWHKKGWVSLTVSKKRLKLGQLGIEPRTPNSKASLGVKEVRKELANGSEAQPLVGPADPHGERKSVRVLLFQETTRRSIEKRTGEVSDEFGCLPIPHGTCWTGSLAFCWHEKLGVFFPKSWCTGHQLC